MDSFDSLGKARRVSRPVSQETCPVEALSTSEGEAPRPAYIKLTRTPSLISRTGFLRMGRSKVIFITGGARSGKSRLAENLAAQFGAPLCYIATAQAEDDEMRERVARHRERRGAEWQTIEEPLSLTEAVRKHQGRYRAILVDCVTLWLANMLAKYDDGEKLLAAVDSFTALFPGLETPLVIVSNEVGMGIVPENDLARRFRDLAGIANEKVARAADEVYVTFSGLPLKLKG